MSLFLRDCTHCPSALGKLESKLIAQACISKRLTKQKKWNEKVSDEKISFSLKHSVSSPIVWQVNKWSPGFDHDLWPICLHLVISSQGFSYRLLTLQWPPDTCLFSISSEDIYSGVT